MKTFVEKNIFKPLLIKHGGFQRSLASLKI